ncbi:pregnancy-specific glycoprotein 22 [Pimephales promelas]|uniref:pregnancy-specific glycoprotein 22 n=1 Tax=Pimephales promelas TaxID=90988 RepID=UPI001955BC3B|nr:pregnancy-specific glycoprotein 22 [Pimephales promelas]
MMLIFGLMLLQTAACVEFTCRFGQPDPCYAALGHKLNLQMLDDRIYKLKIIKRINNNQDDSFCKVKNDTKSKAECDLYNNRPEVTFINGTLIINRVIRADSGNYTLHIDHSDGTVTSADLQVKVEAPIGSVEVSLTCSSSGGKSVSCSSDGDSLVYSWTLNGDPLTDTNTNIHLNETTEGVVICSVKNHVSDGHKGISLDCSGTTTVAVTSHLTSTLTSSTQTPGDGTSLKEHATGNMMDWFCF